jgi:hypothetical protein
MYCLATIHSRISLIPHPFEEHGVVTCFDIENLETLALNIGRNYRPGARLNTTRNHFVETGWKYDVPFLRKIDVYEYDCLQRYLPNWSTTSFTLDTIRQSAAIIRALNRPVVINRGLRDAFLEHDRNRLLQDTKAFDALVGFTSIGSSLHILPDLSATLWKEGSQQSVQIWSEHEILCAYEEAERLYAA